MKVGIIGLGAIGSMHVKNIEAGKVAGAELVAVCDEKFIDKEKYAAYKQYSAMSDLLADKSIEAVIVATPSFNHFEVGQECLKAGKHTLIEKPIGLSSYDAKRIVEVAKESGKLCAVMLNQRTTPLYVRIKELVQSGKLGKINRMSWFMTNWYRPQIYFDCNPWRGTWKGEAGGALINQSIHNIDIFTWIFGLPKTLRGWCKFGKYHNIEVEDEATAYFEYADGMTGVFSTSTGEHPGTNRFEIAADKGFLVAENGKLKVTTFDSLSDYTLNTKYIFGYPETAEVEETFADNGAQHSGVLTDFITAASTGAACAYEASQGYNSVCMANAILLSSWTNSDVTFPFDDEKYQELLAEKISKSSLKTDVRKDGILDFSKSFR